MRRIRISVGDGGALRKAGRFQPTGQEFKKVPSAQLKISRDSGSGFLRLTGKTESFWTRRKAQAWSGQEAVGPTTSCSRLTPSRTRREVRRSRESSLRLEAGDPLAQCRQCAFQRL